MGNNSTPVIYLATLGFICLAVWWIESRFGVNTTGYVLLGLGIAGAVVLGFVLNMANTKGVLGILAKFNQNDAMTDRYRMATFKENAKGEAAERAAQAKLTVLDAKRIDQLAQQRTKALIDVERQKWQGQQVQPAANDDWWTTEPSEEEWG